MPFAFPQGISFEIQSQEKTPLPLLPFYCHVCFLFFFSFKNENRRIWLPKQRKGLKVKGKHKRKSVNIS